MLYSPINKANQPLSDTIRALEEVTRLFFPFAKVSNLANDLFRFWLLCKNNKIDPESESYQVINKLNTHVFDYLEEEYPALLQMTTINFCTEDALYVTGEGERFLKALNARFNYYLYYRQMGDLFTINNIHYAGSIN